MPLKARLLRREIVPSVAIFGALALAALALDGLLHLLDLLWVGRWLGIPGTLLIIASTAYSMRKRKLISRGQPARGPGEPRSQEDPEQHRCPGEDGAGDVHAGDQPVGCAASRAARIAPIGAGCPVISSTCSVACQNSTSRPLTTVPPAAVTRSASEVGQGA